MILFEGVSEFLDSEMDKPGLYFKAYKGMCADDGFNHIRIDPKANTNLGKKLCVDYSRVFYHPKYGSFISIQSAINWLLLDVKDDNIRMMSGIKLLNYIDKEIELGRNSFLCKKIENIDMFSIVFYSLLSKPELIEEINRNELPFCYYYVIKGGYSKVQYIQYTKILKLVTDYITNYVF